MIRTELHCHTIYSKDSLTTPEKLLKACRKKGIDRVAITDHNSIAGALRAQSLDPERVIVGEEVMTQAGELLAFFVQEEVPPGLTPQEAIDLLRAQGAFISVSHPFDRMRKGAWERDALLEIAGQVDAIETFNARCMFPEYNHQADEFARAHQLAATVGSDAHAAFELGQATMLVEAFDTAADLRKLLPGARADVRLSSFWVHFYSRYSVWYKKLFGAGPSPEQKAVNQPVPREDI